MHCGFDDFDLDETFINLGINNLQLLFFEIDLESLFNVKKINERGCQIFEFDTINEAIDKLHNFLN